MKKLILFLLTPLALFAAAGDIKIDTKNSSDNAWISTIFAKQNNAVFVTSASGVPALSTAPTLTGITLSGLTSGRVVFSTTGGQLTDDADMTFVTDTLTVTKGTFGGITHVANAIGAVTSLTSSGATMDVATSSGQNARFSTTHLLLGGLTTDGTGVLQFPAATTSAGGLSFGTDTFIYRAAAGRIEQSYTGGDDRFRINYGSGGNQIHGYEIYNNTTLAASLLYTEASGGSWTFNVSRGGTPIMVFQTGGTTSLTLDSTQNATFSATIRVSTDTLSGAGAVSITKDTTKLTSTGVAQAITLANGTDGQIKRIIHDVDGGSMVLTPTTKTGWSTATFTNAGDSLLLEYVTTRGWIVAGSYGTVVAP